MEKRLFNLYLKYIEESCPSVWERFSKVPCTLKKYMYGMITCYVGAIIGLFVLGRLNKFWSQIDTIIIIILLILCIVCEVRLFFATERYEIQVSDKTMEAYWEYCYGVRKWFYEELVALKQTENKIDDNLIEVKKRIDLRLIEQSQKNENMNTRIDKWVQALAIPFVLAIITAILERNDTIAIAISEIIAIIFVLFIFFGGAYILYSVLKLFKKQKYEQMKRFSEDLQGALDCVKYSQDNVIDNKNKVLDIY